MANHFYATGVCVVVVIQSTLFCITSYIRAAADGETMFKATSNGGGAPKLAEVKRVRSLFPETWIWLDYDAK